MRYRLPPARLLITACLPLLLFCCVHAAPPPAPPSARRLLPASPPLVVWLEAEHATSTNFDDLYPAAGLSGGCAIHFSTARPESVAAYTARYRIAIPRTGRYVLWTRRHLLYYNEGRFPLVDRLKRYIEMAWRIDGGTWRRPAVEAHPVNLKGPFPSSVGHLGYTRSGTADMAGKYIGWYLDSVVSLTRGEHEFEVGFRLRQPTFTPLFGPPPHRYYGLLDAFAFAEPGYVPKGRLRPAFAVEAVPDVPRRTGTGRVEVDAKATGDTIPNLIGFSLVGTNPEQGRRIRALKPALVRMCHIYNLARVSLDEKGKIRIDWTEADKAVDNILRLGARPLMCLSYTPAVLSTKSADVPGGPYAGDPGMYPPSDYDAWEEVVYQTVRHFNRERELRIKYWEVWNEPEGAFWYVYHIWPWLEHVPFSGLFRGPLNAAKKLVLYCRLYEHAARGAVRADPTIRIGGPSVNCYGEIADVVGGVERWWVEVLSRWCEWRDVRLDFISLHFYGSPPDKSGPPDYARLIRQAQRWARRPDGSVPEVIIDEWNAWSMEGGHDTVTPYHAVWVMDTIEAMRRAGARHSVYFGAGGGFLGIFRDGYTPTPTYNLFRMLGLLERGRVPARATPDDIRVTASRSDTRLTVLLWRFGTADRDVEVHIAPLRSGEGIDYRRFLIDGRHSNLRAGGKAHAELTQVDRVIRRDAGRRLRLTIPLPATSVTLLVFERPEGL